MVRNFKSTEYWNTYCIVLYCSGKLIRQFSIVLCLTYLPILSYVTSPLMTIDDWNYPELSNPSPTRRRGWQYLCTETQVSRFCIPVCGKIGLPKKIHSPVDQVKTVEFTVPGFIPYHISLIALHNLLSNMIFKKDAQGCIYEVIVIAHPPSLQSKQCRVLSGLCLSEVIRCISLYQTCFRLVESRNNLITSVSFYSI